MNTLPESVVIVILAAGKGTRMESDTAKVLHKISGRAMIMYVVDTAVRLAGRRVVVVVGNQAQQVQDVVSRHADVTFAFQASQMGTGHAVQCALPQVPETCREVVVLSGDVPLVTPETVAQLVREHHNKGNTVTLIGVRLDNPYGYGRVLLNNTGGVERIVEESDASESEKAINIVNSGIYCIKKSFLKTSLSQILTDNAQNEIYLTDIIGIARHENQRIGLMVCREATELMGVNTMADLRRVEALLIESLKKS